MYKLILIMVVSAMIQSANAANVECKKDGRYWYPVNETAIKITKMLGVKTCNGKRFKAVVSKLGMTSNVVAGKRNMSVEDTIKAIKAGK